MWLVWIFLGSACLCCNPRQQSNALKRNETKSEKDKDDFHGKTTSDADINESEQKTDKHDVPDILDTSRLLYRSLTIEDIKDVINTKNMKNKTEPKFIQNPMSRSIARKTKSKKKSKSKGKFNNKRQKKGKSGKGKAGKGGKGKGGKGKGGKGKGGKGSVQTCSKQPAQAKCLLPKISKIESNLLTRVLKTSFKQFRVNLATNLTNVTRDLDELSDLKTNFESQLRNSSLMLGEALAALQALQSKNSTNQVGGNSTMFNQTAVMEQLEATRRVTGERADRQRVGNISVEIKQKKLGKSTLRIISANHVWAIFLN